MKHEINGEESVLPSCGIKIAVCRCFSFVNPHTIPGVVTCTCQWQMRTIAPVLLRTRGGAVELGAKFLLRYTQNLLSMPTYNSLKIYVMA